MCSEVLKIPGTIGHVFWLFGHSGAGKTTLAQLLGADLRSHGISVLALDGDVLRAGLCRGLGFSDSDRSENLRRAAEVARLATESSISVIAAFITPAESQRTLVRAIVGPERISLIFVDAPLSVCRQRDVKGLYARATAGQIDQMTGISAPFEKPGHCELSLPTTSDAPRVSARTLAEFAKLRLGSHPPPPLKVLPPLAELSPSTPPP